MRNGNVLALNFSFSNENSEASVRGVLLSFAPIASSFGIFIVSLLGSFVSWRQVSLTTSVLPAIIVIAICFVRMTLLFASSSVSIVTSIKHLSLSRFLKHQTGYYQKIVQRKHNDRYNGYADGFEPMQYVMNLYGFKSTASNQTHVPCVPNNPSNVTIHQTTQSGINLWN